MLNVRINSSWRIGVALIALLALLAPGLAQAAPATFDGSGGWGVSDTTAQGLRDAGVVEVLVDAIRDAGSLVESVSQIVQSIDLGGTPVSADSLWTVRNPLGIGDPLLENGWLVLLTPLTYTKNLVGFHMTPGDWALMRVDVPQGESTVPFFYPARRIGTLADGAQTSFLMQHLVGEPLVEVAGEFVLPEYAVGFVSADVPEPGIAGLLLLVGAGLAVSRMRTRC